MASVLPVRKAKDILKHDLPKHVESSSQLGLESGHTQEARVGRLHMENGGGWYCKKHSLARSRLGLPSSLFLPTHPPRIRVCSMHASYPRHEHPLAEKGIESVDNLIVAHSKTYAYAEIESSRHLNCTAFSPLLAFAFPVTDE